MSVMNNRVCGFNRGHKTAGFNSAGAGEFNRSAMVNRGADDRQSQGYIDRIPKTDVLENRKSLVMIHGNYSITVAKLVGQENSVGRPWPGNIQTLSSQGLNRRLDNFNIFMTKMTIFTCMWIETAYPDAWFSNIKIIS